PKSIETEASIWRAAIASIELKDDFNVVMRMKSPQFEVLKSQHDAMAAIVPKKYIEEKGDDYFASHPIGSGPWKVLEYQPGIRLELEAVEDHWRARPRFQRLTVLNVPELSTKIAMLKTGEVDLAGVSPDSIPNLEASGLRILSYWSGGGYYGYPLYDVENPQKYAFGDVRVRKAMQLAVNSKELADKLFRGRASPVTMATNYVEVDAKANAFDPNLLKPDPYDAEGAKKLLAEAGYPDGFNTRIYDVGAGDMRSTLSLALGGYWRKIGVNAEIVPIEYGAFFPKMQSRSPETWNSYYVWVTSGAKTWQRMFTYFHSTKSNPKNNKNPKLDSLLDSIAGTRDPVERERLQLEAAVLSKNDYSLTSVLGTHNILALGKKLGDVGQKPYVYEISGIMFETITHAK
ncbi:MAG: ABC transporter substrate-binding protein, partial [Dehalococcoidia bacterium]|nr:ABC transporter substrate-binding protein [Dehalococcoidia bacterium]